MAKITQNPKVELTVTFTVTEIEARALDAMVGYGYEAFITTFKKRLGQHYMEGHEPGLKQFFEDIRQIIPPILDRTDDARKVFIGEKKAVNNVKKQ